MDKKSTLEKWFKEVWTEENTATIHQMFVPEVDGAAHGLMENKGMGPDEFVEFQQRMLLLVKNVRLKIDSFIEQGDIISADCTLTASDRKTGLKKVTMKGCVVAKITDEKIRDSNNHFDFLNFFEDLGLLPENTFLRCLNGDVI